MEDFFKAIHEDDRAESGGEEPTFSINEFKKWLAKQPKEDDKKERSKKKAD